MFELMWYYQYWPVNFNSTKYGHLARAWNLFFLDTLKRLN